MVSALKDAMLMLTSWRSFRRVDRIAEFGASMLAPTSRFR